MPTLERGIATKVVSNSTAARVDTTVFTLPARERRSGTEKLLVLTEFSKAAGDDVVATGIYVQHGNKWSVRVVAPAQLNLVPPTGTIQQLIDDPATPGAWKHGSLEVVDLDNADAVVVLTAGTVAAASMWIMIS